MHRRQGDLDSTSSNSAKKLSTATGQSHFGVLNFVAPASVVSPNDFSRCSRLQLLHSFPALNQDRRMRYHHNLRARQLPGRSIAPAPAASRDAGWFPARSAPSVPADAASAALPSTAETEACHRKAPRRRERPQQSMLTAVAPRSAHQLPQSQSGCPETHRRSCALSPSRSPNRWIVSSAAARSVPASLRHGRESSDLRHPHRRVLVRAKAFIKSPSADRSPAPPASPERDADRQCWPACCRSSSVPWSEGRLFVLGRSCPAQAAQGD